MSITATTIIDQCIDEVPGIAYKFTGTATSSGATLTTTDAEINKLGANYVATRFQTAFLWIPTGTNGDDIHSVTTMSVSGATTTITTLGNYGSTYTNAAMYLIGIHPSVFLRRLNDALEYIPVECAVPLRHGPDDADMQATGTTSWTAAGNAVLAKQTTDTEVLWGRQSMSLTAGTTGTSMTSTTMRLGQNEPAIGFGLLKADTGTATFSILDNSANVEQTVTTTQEDWVYIRKQKDAGTSDEGAVLRISGSTDGDQIDVQAAWLVKPNINLFRLPSWADERFKFKGIEVHMFRQGGYETDTWLAEAVDRVSLSAGNLVQPADYRYINRQADANPYWVEILPPAQHLLQYPMFIVVECPYSAPYGVSATFSAVTDTTNCPLHLIVPAFKSVLGHAYKTEFPGLAEEADMEFRKRSQKRFTAKAPISEWRGPIGGVRI